MDKRPPPVRRIACIYFPDWPIQRVVVDQPELRCQAGGLFADQPPRGRLVIAVSPMARRHGVRERMPLTEAKSLLRKLPVKYWLPADRSADQRRLEQLAGELSCFSPIVGLETADPPSSLLLDGSGLAHLFGGETAWIEQIANYLQASGYVTRTAVGDTIGQAWALAHFAAGSPEQLATDSAQIARLPPAALRLSTATCETLQRLGIETLAQLQQLPRASLAVRFGTEIYDRWDQLTGSKPETIRSIEPPPQYTAWQLLDFPLRDQETVTVVIGRLMGELCHSLQSQRRGALQWHIRLVRQSATALEFYVDLYEPLADVDAIVELVRLQLEHQPRWSASQTPVEEIGVTVTRWIPLVERQRRLFDDDPQPNLAALGDLVNRLSIRLGPAQVVRPTAVSGVQPEYANRYRPVLETQWRPSKRHAPSRTPVYHSRPARLLSKPLELISLAAHQPTSDTLLPARGDSVSRSWATRIVYPPAAIGSGVYRWRIVRYWGPERIETGWWHGRQIRRDYWRVETDHHLQLWIYRDLRKSAWYLHGFF